jgi:hypothetical protein
MLRFKRRLEKLEKSIQIEPLILSFEDGSTAELPGSTRFINHLYRLFHDESAASPEERDALDMIRRSISIREPGGGRMIELLRALLLSPVGPKAE